MILHTHGALLVSRRAAELYTLAMSFAASPYSRHVAADTNHSPVRTESVSSTGITHSFRVQTRHYWATILDRGRPAVSAQPGKLLVWYKDWRNDPRPRPKYGRHVGKLDRVRHLSKAAFKADLANGLLVVARKVRAVPATNFIADGGARGRTIASRGIREALSHELATKRVLNALIGPGRIRGRERFDL